MALWKPFRGNRTALDAVAKHDGYIYFCVDDGTLFFDYVDADGNLQRKQLNAKNAETLAGYTIADTLNDSATELPTAQAILNALIDYVKKTELAPVATSGLIDDLSIGEGTELIFDGGDSGFRVSDNAASGSTISFTSSSVMVSCDDNEAGGQTATIN